MNHGKHILRSSVFVYDGVLFLHTEEGLFLIQKINYLVKLMLYNLYYYFVILCANWLYHPFDYNFSVYLINKGF